MSLPFLCTLFYVSAGVTAVDVTGPIRDPAMVVGGKKNADLEEVSKNAVQMHRLRNGCAPIRLEAI